MRNASIWKIAIAGWLLLVGFSSGFAQARQMKVTQIGQNKDRWCWAASIEMVMKFHQPSSLITQCQIARTYMVDIRRNNNGINCCSTCNCACSTVNPSSDIPNCNITIDFARETSVSPIRVETVGGYFDLLFSMNNYHSMEKINRTARRIQWNEIKAEINACRPFIAVIKPDPSSENKPSSDHVIVAKGYYDIPKNGLDRRYIITSDPWEICPGNESLFPYEVFNVSAGGTGVTYQFPADSYGIHHVWSIVHNIYPYDTDACISCNTLDQIYTPNPDGTPSYESEVSPEILDDIENNRTTTDRDPNTITDLIAIATSNAEAVVGFDKNVLEDQEYNRFVSRENYYDANIYYIIPEKLNRKFLGIFRCPPKKISKAIDTKQEVKEIVSGEVSPDIVSTFQKTTDKRWALRKISNVTSLKKELSVTINKKNTTSLLSNEIPDATRYDVIRHPTLHYEFYSFQVTEGNSKTTYLSPVKSYPKLSAEAGTAYPEKEILKPLAKENRNYLLEYILTYAFEQLSASEKKSISKKLNKTQDQTSFENQ